VVACLVKVAEATELSARLRVGLRPYPLRRREEFLEGCLSAPTFGPDFHRHQYLAIVCIFLSCRSTVSVIWRRGGVVVVGVVAGAPEALVELMELKVPLEARGLSCYILCVAFLQLEA
jgi:hypothetical protein